MTSYHFMLLCIIIIIIIIIIIKQNKKKKQKKNQTQKINNIILKWEFEIFIMNILAQFVLIENKTLFYSFTSGLRQTFIE